MLLMVQFTETVFGFGASLFGNRFIYRNQYMPTKPGLAYKLRKPYAQKFGSFGDNFINMVCVLYTFTACAIFTFLLKTGQYCSTISPTSDLQTLCYCSIWDRRFHSVAGRGTTKENPTKTTKKPEKENTGPPT